MREPTEVWVIIPPENPRMQWPMQFFGKEEFANAIADEHKRFGVYSIVKRYALTAAPSVATPDARRVDDGPTMASLFGACPNATKGDGDDDARRVVESAIAFAGALEQAREVVSDEDGMYTPLDKTQAKSEVNYREDLLLAAVRALAATTPGDADA